MALIEFLSYEELLEIATSRGFMRSRKASVRIAFIVGEFETMYDDGEEGSIKSTVTRWNRDVSHPQNLHVKCQFQEDSTVRLTRVPFDGIQRTISKNAKPKRYKGKHEKNKQNRAGRRG